MRTVPAVLLLPLLSVCSGAACSGARPAEVEAPAPAPGPPEPSGGLEAEIVAAIDPAVEPCDDFYAYACGGWLASTELPADKPILVRSFSTIGDRNELVLRELLEGLAAGAPTDADRPDDAKLAAFYRSCTDEAAIDARGVEPLAPLFARIDALPSAGALMGLAGELSREGLPTVAGVWTDADAKNPGLSIIQLAQGGTGLPERGYYFDERHAEIRDQYRAHLAKLLALAGASAEDAEQGAADVLAFETALAEHHWAPEALRDSLRTYNKVDRTGLDALTPTLDWGAFLEGLGRPELTQFNVLTPPFFEALGPLLARTDLAVLKTWLRVRVLSAAADDLAAPVADEAFRFHGQVLTGQKEQRPRWKRCVEKTDAALGDLLAKAYIEREFAGDSKEIAVDMIARIERAFEEGLVGLGWMDDETRARAVEKAQAITNKIGYPANWRQYPFEVADDDFFGNQLRAARSNQAYWLEKAEKPVDPDTWFMTAPTVNAYYNPTQNEIAFPAGILQPPFFSADFPKAVNFGAMGMVMGHELTHGFDDDGRKFDGEGRLTEWWAETAVEKFEEAAACVDDQYDAYEVEPGLHLSGSLTLGENIADVGGLRLAYRAYRQWVADHGEEPPLAGLTGDQLLFVSHAQAWCSVASPEVARVRVASDPHAPPRFRVIGPVVNLPEFGDAFGCEVGDPMRPAETCEVW
jgi:putative endopeptidase